MSSSFSPNLSKNPVQQVSSKHLDPRALHTPTHLVSPPTIPPPTRISHNLSVQIPSSLAHRPAPAIPHDTTACPLSARLHTQILRLEFPLGVRGARGIPHAQRVMQLETNGRRVLLRVEREVLLERGGEEEGTPFCEGRPSDGWRGGVGGEEGGGEEVGFCYIYLGR
jgi:hypothetical protein